MTATEAAALTPVRIFVCSSAHDEEYLAPESLLGFLRGLEQESVEFRHGDPGNWNDETRAAVAASDIALVLVSQGFLDSGWCTNGRGR